MSAPVFRPFTWLSPAQQGLPHARYLALLADARDVAAGASEIAAMLEIEEINDECEGANGNEIARLFPVGTRGNLQRMAVASLAMLAERLGTVLGEADPAPAHGLAGLDRLIPADPCAGMMLSAEEAAGLVELRARLEARD